MPGRALRCFVEVKINTLSCPGVWLPSRRGLYLRFSMMDTHYQSKLLDSTFPLLVFQTFQFEKLFRSCFDPAGLAEQLEAEPVYLELVQVCPQLEVDPLIAFYRTDARSFLFPTPTLRPSYCGTNRDVLFQPRSNFPSVIGPKMVFCTSTVILEAGFSSFTHPMSTNLKNSELQRLATATRKRSRSHSPEYSFYAHNRGSQCTVCYLFKKYFGRRYAGHQHLHSSENRKWLSEVKTANGTKNHGTVSKWDNNEYYEENSTDEDKDSSVDIMAPKRGFVSVGGEMMDHKTYRQLFNESLANMYEKMSQCDCCRRYKSYL